MHRVGEKTELKRDALGKKIVWSSEIWVRKEREEVDASGMS